MIIVISDTPGLLRPEAVSTLEGADRIIHAGDIGGPERLGALAKQAPLPIAVGRLTIAAGRVRGELVTIG